MTLDVCNLLPDGILTDVWGGLPGRVSKESSAVSWFPRARPRSSARGEVAARMPVPPNFGHMRLP